jgi:hypothetical protein
MFSLLTESDRKVILFTYENHTKNKISIPVNFLSDEERSYILTEGEYILWELEKRKLTRSEVIAHSWLITSKKNHTLLFRFLDDSSMTISSLFDNESGKGSWFLEHGILKINFKYQNHDYALDVIANNNRMIHSALQIVDDTSIDILKVVPVSHAKYGNALND